MNLQKALVWGGGWGFSGADSLYLSLEFEEGWQKQALWRVIVEFSDGKNTMF